MVRAHRQAWAWQDEWFGLTMEQIRELERETQRALALKMKSVEADERSVTNEDDEDNEEDEEEEDNEDEEEQEDQQRMEPERPPVLPKNRLFAGRTSSTETAGKDRPISDVDSLKSSWAGDRSEHRKKSRSNSRATILQTPGKCHF